MWYSGLFLATYDMVVMVELLFCMWVVLGLILSTVTALNESIFPFSLYLQLGYHN